MEELLDDVRSESSCSHHSHGEASQYGVSILTQCTNLSIVTFSVITDIGKWSGRAHDVKDEGSLPVVGAGEADRMTAG
jgi:hypothetical protein